MENGSLSSSGSISRPDVGSSPHAFEKSKIITPVLCNFCFSYIWGLQTKKGYICKGCFSSRCLEYVPNMCMLDKSDYKKVNNPLYAPKERDPREIHKVGSAPAIMEVNSEKKERRDTKKKNDKTVGSPFNVEHKTHVDFNLQWSGKQDPSELFEIKEELGKGAFATVYRIVHRETGLELAAKITPTRAEMKEGLRREIEVLRKCRSPNVLSYYGSVVKGNEVWILMDYCAVGSTKDLMKITLETLEEDQISHVIQETLKGLAYLHKMELMHLDIKAANILLTNSGQVKIADFGVSEQIQKGTLRKNEVQDFVGSPLYMAPEVIIKDKYNNKADVWSLGITCIELAEGRPPNNDIKSMSALLTLPNRPPPKLKNPKMWTPSFNDFLAKILVKDPNERPSAVDALTHPFIQGAKGPDVLKPLIATCLVNRLKQREKLDAAVKASEHPKTGTM